MALLDIDMAIVEKLLAERFASKKALRESNTRALLLGHEYAKKHFDCPLPFHLETDGRECRQDSDRRQHGGGARLCLCGRDSCRLVSHHARHVRDGCFQGILRDDTARIRKPAGTTIVILQAEDEMAAIGMVIGAMWNGARAFTSTAGPGISLMNELLGLAYYAEIPVVVIDVQRVGPSTGMPTRTQQGDILECAYASHGDTKHILLFPANPAECFEFAPYAFDLAERFQTPVIMLSDLDIGMNDWVVPRLQVERIVSARPRPCPACRRAGRHH